MAHANNRHASASRLDGDNLNKSPPSYPQWNEAGQEHEYDVLPKPLPKKPPSSRRPPAVVAQPTGNNKRFNSYVEGGDNTTNASDNKTPAAKNKQFNNMEISDENGQDEEIVRQGYVAVVVSGIRFVSPRDPILSHAGTRLGQAVASATINGLPMLQMYGTDAASDIAGMNTNSQKSEDDATVYEFYCDRNPMIFPHILQYYRTGTLHLPHTLCWDFVKDELDFWGIDHSAIPECCMTAFRKHERHIVYTRLVQVLFFAEKIDVKRMNRLGPMRMGELYKFLYDVEGSWRSYLYFYFYMILALLFAISFILQLNEFFRVGHPPTIETNTTHCIRFEPHNPQSNVKLYFLTHPHPALRWFDMFAIVWFSIDLILRFICYPSKVLFLCNAPNIIELICLAGNYFSISLVEISGGHFWCSVSLLKTYLAIEILRVFRLTRIPFFSPRYSWMRVLLLTLKRGFTELMLLVALVFVFVMFFGYLIMIPEMWRSTKLDSGQKSTNANIYQPHLGMWWAIVTMATVGYGDYYPTSPIGYVIGSLCAVTGVLFLSLQVPLISNRFNLLYQYAKQESNKLDEIKKQKDESRRQILEEERIRRERFWRKQFQKEENWEEAFRSGKVNEEIATTTADYESVISEPPVGARTAAGTYGVNPAVSANNNFHAAAESEVGDGNDDAARNNARMMSKGRYQPPANYSNRRGRGISNNAVATMSYRKNNSQAK